MANRLRMAPKSHLRAMFIAAKEAGLDPVCCIDPQRGLYFFLDAKNLPTGVLTLSGLDALPESDGDERPSIFDEIA